MIAGRSKVCYNKHLSCSYRYFDCFYCELIQSIIYSIRKTSRVRKLKMTFELIFALFVSILLEVHSVMFTFFQIHMVTKMR